MAQIIVYLSFNGNCREAMLFYQHCLGGELCLQTVEESPCSNQMPVYMKHHILHASLIHERFILMGSDMVGREDLDQGNSIALYLHCDTKEQMDRLVGLLLSCPQQQSGGVLIGRYHTIDVLDRFGFWWKLVLDENLRFKV